MDATQEPHPSKNRVALTLAALGIVFGDIGTSPLYALRECFSHSVGIPLAPENILGVLSLILWSLFVVVFGKYMVFILRANNRGEGGILALLALALPQSKVSGGRKRILTIIGIFGAALLYGDGMITPAISVLSAVEGLSVATTIFNDYISLLTVLILALLFSVQRFGTNKIGSLFGPFILLYFTVLALLGLPHIIEVPSILKAFNPMYALNLAQNYGMMAFWMLGSVFLVVTGCEALYADMGHFGRKPIQLAWLFVVFPSLAINYLGQGALLILDPKAISNPFFNLAPTWALYPLVVIVTLATVVASQALISGVFSLTRQAILLGYAPRMNIVHTSSDQLGQIYVPFANWVLMIGTIWLVVEFDSSSNLAGAYGIAVSLTMLITTLLALLVARRRWHFSYSAVAALGTVFLVVDLAFLGANLNKILEGGWVPLTIGLFVLILMTTWKKGRRILAIRLRHECGPLENLIESDLLSLVHRIPGTGVFMASDPDMVPPALARNLHHNKVANERILIMSFIFHERPRIAKQDRVDVETLPGNILKIKCHFGFIESPNIMTVLEAMRAKNIDIPIEEMTFYLGRETLIASKSYVGMAIWREILFSFMSRNSSRATIFFKLPPNQVIEIGSQIEL